MAMHRALTDFYAGTDPEGKRPPVQIVGGNHYDDRDKTYAPIIARFPDKFEAIK